MITDTPERLPKTVWPEMGVVLWIGVISPVLNSIGRLLWPVSTELKGEVSFVEDAYWQIQYSVLLSVVMAYLLWRSGELWSHWGVVRFVWWRDTSIGIGLWLTAWFLQDVLEIVLRHRVVLATYEQQWPSPSSPSDYFLLVSMCCMIGFSEEVVARGYLLPRFERLFKSTTSAVVVTSILFAIGHIYQGPSPVARHIVLGLVYGTCFAWLRRLWPLVIAHALADFIALRN